MVREYDLHDSDPLPFLETYFVVQHKFYLDKYSIYNDLLSPLLQEGNHLFVVTSMKPSKSHS